MKPFINNNFLLTNDTADWLYHDYAKRLPIIDYHCHLDPREIAEDKKFDNLADIWLSHDHYKWRLMRAAGVSEDLITGNASPKDKFLAWAKVIGRSWGNPLYHWSALELARYFDYYQPLNEENAEEVWESATILIEEDNMRPSWFLEQSNVELLCTTDDPADDLKHHAQIRQEGKIKTRVLPSFRPDKAVEIGSSDFPTYIANLADTSGIDIKSYADIRKALSSRLDFFAFEGCVLSDHGMEKIPFNVLPDSRIEEIFAKRMNGEVLSADEESAYKTSILLFLAREYSSRGWTMQIHFGCRRNNNSLMLADLGRDIGCDTIAGCNDIVTPLAQFLSALEEDDALPKMILYSLDPSYNPQIDTLIGCFQKGPDVMKIQHGAAWWFNDNIRGMEEQMRGLAEQSYFPGFIGMLTDSRSFMSYPRHEYFRRILCNMVGESVERGLFPDDEKILSDMINGICHDNAAKHFK